MKLLPTGRFFIDPTPATARQLSRSEMEQGFGGNVAVIVIATCSGALGAYTVVTAGSVIVAIAA